MNFGTNLSAARRAKGLSQEELAERLCVSRQTIYKWEAGITYPDVGKLCDIAKCLDVGTAYLLGEETENAACTVPAAEETEACAATPLCDSAATVQHYRRFGRMIGACTLLILLSVAALVLLNGFSASWASALSVIQLLCCIALAVVGYVVAGLRHEPVEKQQEHPVFEKEEKQREQRCFVVKIVSGIALIFVGVIFVVVAGFLEIELLHFISVSALLALIGVAVYLFITAGILHDLYMGEDSPRKAHEEKKEPHEAACSIIMLLATAVFLLLGFVWDLWHPAWVAFPLGGLLCGCVGILFGSKNKAE